VSIFSSQVLPLLEEPKIHAGECGSGSGLPPFRTATDQSLPAAEDGKPAGAGSRHDPGMSELEWLAIGAGITIGIYLVLVLALVLLGRRADARALARFIPDCLVLLRRLVGDERVPKRRKMVLVALVAYLAMPIDLVPDFIPVVGQLDDVIIAALALRYALRSGGPELLREHWPGPQESLGAVLRLAYRRSDVSSEEGRS
jgi:uncharacterized membrane protein YkvA (DUF1232 family)